MSPLMSAAKSNDGTQSDDSGLVLDLPRVVDRSVNRLEIAVRELKPMPRALMRRNILVTIIDM